MHYKDGLIMKNINNSEHIFTQYSVRLSNELRTHLKNAAKKNTVPSTRKL